MKRKWKWGLFLGTPLMVYGVVVAQATLHVRAMLREQVGIESRISGIVFPLGIGMAVIGSDVAWSHESNRFSADMLWLSGMNAGSGIMETVWVKNFILVMGTDTVTASEVHVQGLEVAAFETAVTGQSFLSQKPFSLLRGKDLRFSSKGDVATFSRLDISLGEHGQVVDARAEDGQILKISGAFANFSDVQFSGLAWPVLAGLAGLDVMSSPYPLKKLDVQGVVAQGSKGEKLSCGHCSLLNHGDDGMADLIGENLVFMPVPDGSFRELLPDGMTGNLSLRLAYDRNTRVLVFDPLRVETLNGILDVEMKLGNVPDVQAGNPGLLFAGGVTLIKFSGTFEDSGLLLGILQRRAEKLEISMAMQAETLIKDIAGLSGGRDSEIRSRRILQDQMIPFLTHPDGVSVVFQPVKPIPLLGLCVALSLQPELVLPLLERGDLVLDRKRH
ncbi:MAG TPA: hypothetical protein DCW68_06705 [Rhodospirillaceae bacterium]|nr:MAG: hypothetical protein A2018_01215 [Alphaproteobacteria bacterium GWF2_58_20]HAU29777.1 hypothetical protein [Rhodospirillaceae bacterium]